MAIVKVLSRHSPSFGSLIKYILRYIGNEEKTHTTPFYTNNLRSNSINGFVNEFTENEAFRRQSRCDQINLYHEIISFHSDENQAIITQEMIDNLAQAYMRLRGSTGVMLGAAHRDKHHVHLHFCVSALHFRTGKSFGLNKAQLRELKQSFQQYHKEQYPELTKSFPEHGKATRYITHSQWHKYKREQIVNIVKGCFAKSNTQNEFLGLLRDQELHYYERNGKPMGIEYEGNKFRFTRLLESNEFERLPFDRNEVDTVLQEIQAVRQRQSGRESRTRDFEDRAR